MQMEDSVIHRPEDYDMSKRKRLSEEISGAVFRTDKDDSHPLSFGLGDTYWTLKWNAAAYAWLPSSGNAVFLREKPVYYGFTGKKAYERIGRTLVAGKESIGHGGVVYLVDNPLFRSFWNSGKVLFSNAVFF